MSRFAWACAIVLTSRFAWACAIVLGLSSLAGCGDTAPAPPGYDQAMPPTDAAFMTLPTTGGIWHLDVSAPTGEGPRQGPVPRDGQRDGHRGRCLAITLVPWMPAHGHGTSIAPTVTADADGRYLATPVNLYMAGRWELRTTISRTPAGDSDNVVFTIDVP